MRPRSLGLTALALVLLARLAAAEPPDVSSNHLSSNLAGRWTLVVENADPGAPPPPIPATASSGWGREITISSEDGRVTIERHQFAELDVQPPMRYVYVLGGAASRNVVNMGRGPQEQVARADWKGETLVIAARHAKDTDLAAEVTQTFSIDAEGALVVVTTRTANGVTSTTKARYRKQPLPSPSPAMPSRPGSSG
jgi:hypothetical protein